jgi:hypothetical protein
MGNDTFYTQETAHVLEETFAEAVNTANVRIPTLGLSRVTLRQDRMPDPAVRSRQNEQGLSHIGGRSASLEFDTYFIGHLSATTGALAQTWQNELFQYTLGGFNTSQDGGTVNAPTSASQFSTTGVTALSGAVIRVGSKGDTRCDGQAAVVNVAATLTTLTALPAAPNAADVVYATQMAYHDESTANSLSSGCRSPSRTATCPRSPGDSSSPIGTRSRLRRPRRT